MAAKRVGFKVRLAWKVVLLVVCYQLTGGHAVLFFRVPQVCLSRRDVVDSLLTARTGSAFFFGGVFFVGDCSRRIQFQCLRMFV